MSTFIFARPGQFALTLCLFAAPLACGDDKGGATDAATEATTTQTTPPTTTDPTPGTTTQTPTEAGTDTDAPTTTADPTAGPSGLFCQEECTDDADCTLAGMDAGFTCQDGRCAGDAPAGCTETVECTAQFSGWATDCADQAACPGQVCVDIGGGVGKCATSSEVVSCDTIAQDEIELMTIEGDMSVTVCGNSTVKCEDGACVDPCTADADCAPFAGHPTCNTDNGRCECSADDQCAGAGIPGFAVCNNGTCGCGEDADCAGSPTADTCYEGACGCSGVDVCTGAMTFDGTTKVCEGF